MLIGGFQKFSLIDYPGKPCAIIYTCGCNFRCPYCHNPELVLPERYAAEIPVSTVVEFLKKRQGLLEAVSITGGEPTLQEDLAELIMLIKEMGYAVKLDTNGSKPKLIKELIEGGLLDHIAMDVKAPLVDYQKASGFDIPPGILQESIQIIMSSGLDYEFRTTVDRILLDEEDLVKIAESIRGARKYYLQKLNYTSEKHVGACNALPEDEVWLRQMAGKLSPYVDFCEVR